MAATSTSALLDRLAALEQEVRDLKARVALLQRAAADRAEHPVDRTLVREKTVYDWQAPR